MTLIEYMKKQWISKAVFVCQFNNQRRTNNCVESFHKNASDELGGIHPNMYCFLRKFLR